MSREDQYSVTVALNGTPLGVFDKMSGGEKDSDEKKYRPGAMAEEVSLGGATTVTNVTIARLYELDRDHTLVPTLRDAVGRGSMVVTKQPLDVDGNVFGSPIVYTGKLKQMTLPDHDSNSSDAGMIQLEVSSASMT